MHTLISSSESFIKLSSTIMALDIGTGFFTSVAWYKNFIDTVIKRDGDSCFFIHVNKNDANGGTILPIKLIHHKDNITIKSLTNYYSPIYKIISRKLEACDLYGFFEEIGDLKWSTIEFRPLPFEDTFFLRKILKGIKFPSIPFFCFGNWYLPVNGRSFDEYFLTLSSQVKNTVNRKTKKFYKIPNSSIEILRLPSDLDQAIQAFQAVYASSWKNPEPYPDFIPGLIKIAAEQGSLRLGIAYLGDKPIASQLWIVADNTAYIYKLSYDEAYKQHSAGTVLTAKMMQYVIDHDKVDVVDYLCGDDDYKKEWMSHRRERWGLLIFNTSNLRGIFMLCKEMPKYWLKSCFIFLKKMSAIK